MVDVESRINNSSHAHVAGLKRLSARANAGGAAPTASRRVCFSFAAYARNVIDHLRRCHVSIARGLSDEEFARIEAAYGFTFPPDLRGILQEGLPVGAGFPDWRQGGPQHLRMRLNSPLAGLAHEVARGRFWWKAWGPRPADAEQAAKVARAALRKAPILVPIYNHCYIPCAPNLAGNPVLFVYQRQVFYCGFDLADYFEREAFVPRNYEPPSSEEEFPAAAPSTPAAGAGAGAAAATGSGRRDALNSYSHSHVEAKRHPSRKDKSLAARLRVGEGDDGEGRKLPWIDEGNEAAECRLQEEEEQAAAAAAAAAAAQAQAQLDSGVKPGGRTESESWGRNLDTLAQAFPRASDTIPARKSDASEPVRQPDGWWRASSALESQASPRKVADAFLADFSSFPTTHAHHQFPDKQPLPRAALAQFTISAPPWAAKSARRIEFWSDLVEKKQLMNAAATDTHFTSYKVEVDAAKLPRNEALWEDHALADFRRKFIPKWLSAYLQDHGTRLRLAGWSEDDISDMLHAPPGPERTTKEPVDKQLLLDRLSVQVELLAGSLKKAGWSTEDVDDILKVGSWHRKRAPAKAAPQQLATTKNGKISSEQECRARNFQYWKPPRLMRL